MRAPSRVPSDSGIHTCSIRRTGRGRSVTTRIGYGSSPASTARAPPRATPPRSPSLMPAMSRCMKSRLCSVTIRLPVSSPAGQVVQVAAGVRAAGGTAPRSRSARCSLGCPPWPGRAASAVPGWAPARCRGGRDAWGGAVERVDARGHGVDQVVHVADTEQVARGFVGAAPPSTSPAPRASVPCPRRACRRWLFPGHPAGHVGRRLGAQVLVHPPLDDPVQHLARWRVLLRTRPRTGSSHRWVRSIERTV